MRQASLQSTTSASDSLVFVEGEKSHENQRLCTGIIYDRFACSMDEASNRGLISDLSYPDNAQNNKKHIETTLTNTSSFSNHPFLTKDLFFSDRPPSDQLLNESRGNLYLSHLTSAWNEVVQTHTPYYPFFASPTPLQLNPNRASVVQDQALLPVSYTHLTLPTIYSV